MKWVLYLGLALALHIVLALYFSVSGEKQTPKQVILKISLSADIGGETVLDHASKIKTSKQHSPTSGSASAKVRRRTKYVRYRAPDYPRRALELGQEGLVLVSAEIMNGRPRQIKLLTSSGYRLLDEAAMAAVQGWVFETDSQTARVKVPVRFVIE